jgi:hypothetical protein
MVNVWFPAALDLWFRNGGRASATSAGVVNQKFTPNRIDQIRREISSALSQSKHLRFIDGC